MRKLAQIDRSSLNLNVYNSDRLSVAMIVDDAQDPRPVDEDVDFLSDGIRLGLPHRLILSEEQLDVQIQPRLNRVIVFPSEAI